MDNKRRNKIIRKIIFIGIGLAILIGLIFNVGFNNFRENLTGADPVLIALSFSLFISVMFFKIVRWSILFPQLDLVNSAKVFSIGQIINESAPIGSGEFTRGIVANTKYGISFGKTLAPAMIERISDVTFLFTLTLLFVFIIFTGESYLIIIIFLVILLSVAYLFLFRPLYIEKLSSKVDSFGSNRTGIIQRLAGMGVNFLNTFKEALLKFHRRRSILGYTIALTIIAWSVEAYGQLMLIHAFGVGSEINYFSFMSLMAAAWIIGTFSFLPGGLGVRETVFAIFLFELFAISTDAGSTIAIVYRLLNYSMLASFAGISFITLPKEKK
jgi:uncharacterized protein (TIRG00374 family)